MLGSFLRRLDDQLQGDRQNSDANLFWFVSFILVSTFLLTTAFSVTTVRSGNTPPTNLITPTQASFPSETETATPTLLMPSETPTLPLILTVVGSVTPEETITETLTVSPIITDTAFITPTDTTTSTLTETPTATAISTLEEHLTVTLTTTVSPALCAPIPVDVVLVIDRSSSMRGQPLADAKQAAKSFAASMNLEIDQIGLVSFASSGQLDQPLTHNQGAITNAIDNLITSNGTNIIAGIAQAQSELTSTRHNAAASRVIILLSDGQPNVGTPLETIQAAASAKQVGIHIITIGLGSQLDENLMRSLATQGTDYYHAPNPSDLLEIYQTIAQGLRCDTPIPTLAVAPLWSLTPSPTPTRTGTVTSVSSLTPSMTVTPTTTPQSTSSATPSFTPSRRHTPSSTPSFAPSKILTPTGTHQKPHANKQSVSLAEDQSLEIRLTGFDADNKALTYKIKKPPLHGEFHGKAPNLIYFPYPDYYGADSFMFEVDNGVVNSAPARVDIDVRSINDVPIAQDDRYNTLVDTTLSLVLPGLLGNDSDVDGDTIRPRIVNQPIHGSLTLQVNGSFIYMPASHYTGSDSFTYQVFDGKTNSNIAHVSIDVRRTNTTPLANSEQVTTPEDTMLTINLTASDLENDSLTYTITVPPLHGKLSGKAPNFVYKPDLNYNQPDRFNFTVSDGFFTSNEASVSINISPVNDPPIAAGDPNFSLDEDATLSAPVGGILANDQDADGDPFTAVLTRDGNVRHGELTLNADGSFIYKPFHNYNGHDSFTYTANDGALNSNTVIVDINIRPVSDAPVCDAFDPSFEGIGGGNQEIPLSCHDDDGDSLQPTVQATPIHGSVSVSGEKFIYVPDEGYYGPDTFIYNMSDGELTSNAVPVVIPNNQLRKPILIKPTDGETLVQSLPPFEWQFVWNAPADPCYSIITINDLNGPVVYTPVHSLFGEQYKYVYQHTVNIPDDKLESWSWSVIAQCGESKSTSKLQNFRVGNAPIDPFGLLGTGVNIATMISMVMPIIIPVPVIYALIYIISLMLFIINFEKAALIVDQSRIMRIFLLNIDYFVRLEVVLLLLESYKISNIKKRSAVARELAKINREFASINADFVQARKDQDSKRENLILTRYNGLEEKRKQYNEEITAQVKNLQIKYKNRYEKLKFWRQE